MPLAAATLKNPRPTPKTNSTTPTPSLPLQVLDIDVSDCSVSVGYSPNVLRRFAKRDLLRRLLSSRRERPSAATAANKVVLKLESEEVSNCGTLRD